MTSLGRPHFRKYLSHVSGVRDDLIFGPRSGNGYGVVLTADDSVVWDADAEGQVRQLAPRCGGDMPAPSGLTVCRLPRAVLCNAMRRAGQRWKRYCTPARWVAVTSRSDRCPSLMR